MAVKLSELIQAAESGFVTAPGRYVVRPVKAERVESSRGTPGLRVTFKVVDVIHVEEGDPGDQLGALITDTIYFTEKALGRVALFASRMGLVSDEEKAQEFPNRGAALAFLQRVVTARAAQPEFLEKHAVVDVVYEPGRPVTVFDPETGTYREEPGEPRLRVPFDGYGSWTVPEDENGEDEGPEPFDPETPDPA